MSIFLNVLAGTALSILLVKSTAWMIRSSARLARHFKISEYTISFLVIAFATSLPELIVGIISAFDNNSALSYGNVLGSNIADLTIILAIPIFVGGGITTREIIKNKDLVYTLFFGLLPIALIYDGVLSRWDAVALLLSYVFYLFLVLRRSSTIHALIESFNQVKVVRELFIFFVSIAVLLLSAGYLVKIAENLSLVAKLPLFFVGLTVTALGTSLPELVFGLKAIKAHHKGEVLGNIVGSVIANSTLVLAATALINPITKDGNQGIVSLIFLVVTLLLFFWFSTSNRKIDKLEAVTLFLIYVLFVCVERYFAF